MTSASAWMEDAFLDEGEAESIDGGTTSAGPLWHAISPRWGHSMHTMCSYHGMFPPKLVHYFVQRFTQPSDLVLDPFSGRGTTILQARAEGRHAVGNDLNPLAHVLTRAKSNPPSWPSVLAAIDRLEKDCRFGATDDEEAPEDIRMLYHPRTLSQLLFIRRRLFRRHMSKWSRQEFMIAGAVAGILHGNHRRDGSSQYLSISMPNTFSMSPSYVRKYIRDNGLTQPDQDVFECLRNKIARLYLDSIAGESGVAYRSDAVRFLNGGRVADESVDLLLTSPPYLDVVNYGTANWIRLWWLGVEEVSRDSGSGRRLLDSQLDHKHNIESYTEFMKQVFVGARRVLRKNGVAVFVIGDVASPGRGTRSLATEVWDAVGSETGLRLVQVIEDDLNANNKVSRIWGDTKGNATNRDCILVLARKDGRPEVDSPNIAWDEPYKDGGPDEAHARARGRNRAGR